MLHASMSVRLIATKGKRSGILQGVLELRGKVRVRGIFEFFCILEVAVQIRNLRNDRPRIVKEIF